MIHLIDSNLYIRAFRDAAFGQTLRDFHRSRLASIVLSAVVIHELLVGATTARSEQRLRRGLLEPFHARRRLHVPSLQTWDVAARVDRRLRTRRALATKLRSRSFFNDMLIAASAREIGAVIVTDNRTNPAEHKKFVESEINKWGPVIKAAGTYAD